MAVNRPLSMPNFEIQPGELDHDICLWRTVAQTRQRHLTRYDATLPLCWTEDSLAALYEPVDYLLANLIQFTPAVPFGTRNSVIGEPVSILFSTGNFGGDLGQTMDQVVEELSDELNAARAHVFNVDFNAYEPFILSAYPADAVEVQEHDTGDDIFRRRKMSPATDFHGGRVLVINARGELVGLNDYTYTESLEGPPARWDDAIDADQLARTVAGERFAQYRVELVNIRNEIDPGVEAYMDSAQEILDALVAGLPEEQFATSTYKVDIDEYNSDDQLAEHFAPIFKQMIRSFLADW